MKTTTEKLCDVGQPVSDSTLILNLLRGLNGRYTTTADHITTTNLTFSYARDQLILKELCLANMAKVAASTALLASLPPAAAPTASAPAADSNNSSRNAPTASSGTPRRAARSPTAAAAAATTVAESPYWVMGLPVSRRPVLGLLARRWPTLALQPRAFWASLLGRLILPSPLFTSRCPRLMHSRRCSLGIRPS
jgi:hypothetical protein